MSSIPIRSLGKLCLLAIWASAGCGSSADGNVDAAAEDDSVAYRAFIDEFVRADCEREQRCKTPPAHDSADACVADQEPMLSRQRAAIADSIDRGATAFVREAAAECLDL